MTELVDMAPAAVAATTLEHTYCVHSGMVVACFHFLLLKVGIIIPFYISGLISEKLSHLPRVS